jgi:hypothetical protein
MEVLEMETEIGNAAGVTWRLLAAKGTMPLTQLKQEAGLTEPLLLMAIGWLAREEKVEITRDRRSFRIGLRQQTTAA